MIHVKKQHNKELRHIIEMLSMVIKDLLLHCCTEVLETKVYVSYDVRCHSNNYLAAREYPSLEKVIFIKYDSFQNQSTKIGNYYYRSKNWTVLQQCIKCKLKKVMVMILQGSVLSVVT